MIDSLAPKPRSQEDLLISSASFFYFTELASHCECCEQWKSLLSMQMSQTDVCKACKHSSWALCTQTLVFSSAVAQGTPVLLHSFVLKCDQQQQTDKNQFLQVLHQFEENHTQMSHNNSSNVPCWQILPYEGSCFCWVWGGFLWVWLMEGCNATGWAYGSNTIQSNLYLRTQLVKMVVLIAKSI